MQRLLGSEFHRRTFPPGERQTFMSLSSGCNHTRAASRWQISKKCVINHATAPLFAYSRVSFSRLDANMNSWSADQFHTVMSDTSDVFPDLNMKRIVGNEDAAVAWIWNTSFYQKIQSSPKGSKHLISSAFYMDSFWLCSVRMSVAVMSVMK